MDYLKKTYGLYSQPRDDKNKRACDNIPMFSSVTTVLSGMAKYKILMRERESWTIKNPITGDVINTYESSDYVKQLWILKRLDTRMFSFMITKIKEDGMDFIRIKEYLTTTLQDLKERAELTECSATHNPDEGTYIPEYMDQTSMGSLAMNAQTKDTREEAKSQNVGEKRLCFVCNSPLHVARNCPSTKMPNYDGSRPFHPHENKRIGSGRGGLVVPFRSNHQQTYGDNTNKRDRYRSFGNNSYSSKNKEANGYRSYYKPQDTLIKGLREKTKSASVAGMSVNEDQVLEDLDTVYHSLRQKIASGDTETVNSIWYNRDDDQETGHMSFLTDPRDSQNIVNYAGHSDESYYDFSGSSQQSNPDNM
jgi:hypothetical protein